MRRSLIIESSLCTPHTETGIELYHLNNEKPNEAKLFPLISYLPTNENNLWNAKLLYESNCKKIESFYKTNEISLLQVEQTKITYHFKNPRDDKELEENIHKTFPVGQYVKGMLHTIFRTHKINYSDNNVQTVLELLIYCGVTSYEYTLKACEDYLPESVFVFNGRFPTSAGAVHACKDLQIDYTLHERSTNLSDYWLEKGSLHDPEIIMRSVKNLSSNRPPDYVNFLGSKFFINCRKGIGSTIKTFSKNFTQRELPKGFEKNEYAIFFVGTEFEQGACSGILMDIGFGNQQQAVSKLLNVCKQLKRPLMIRMHPNMVHSSHEEIGFYKNLEDDGILVIGPEDNLDSYFLLENSMVAITYISTIGAESLYALKPTIALGKSAYYFCEELMKPRTVAELASCLKNPKTPKTNKSVKEYGYWQTEKGTKHIFYQPEKLFSGIIHNTNLNTEIFRYNHQE